MTPRSLSHIALGVRDLDRSLHFYCDLLGFQVAQEGTEFEADTYRLGAICEHGQRKFRLAVLRYGQESVGAFGMNEGASVISLVAPLDLPPTGTGIKLDQIGISHFGISVKDLDAIYQDLKSKGVTFAVPPTTTKTDAGTIHSAFVKDPDGILVELQELIPA